MATHSSILAWKSHGQRNQVGYSPLGLILKELTLWQPHLRSVLSNPPTLGVREARSGELPLLFRQRLLPGWSQNPLPPPPHVNSDSRTDFPLSWARGGPEM